MGWLHDFREKRRQKAEEHRREIGEAAQQHAAEVHEEVTKDEPAVSPVVDLTPRTAFDRVLPKGVQIASSWAWRLVAIAVAMLGLGWLLRYLSEVTIPVAIAILLTAMLQPLMRAFRRIGVPHGLAVLLSIVVGLLLVGGVLSGIVAVIANQYEDLVTRATDGLNQLVAWLNSGPLKINQQQLNGYIESLQQWLMNSRAQIASYAASIGTSVGHFFAGMALMFFSLIYFLHDGRRIWLFVLNLLPSVARERADLAAHMGWTSLVAYVRATVAVAAVDAIGALIGALILGVPMAPALAALIFLGAFIPLVGAFVSGFVAVAVALVTLGVVKAAIMLAVIVGVMFVEGHFLQPFLLGKAVAVHPLAVLLGIAVGVIVGGIIGALIVIPIIAFGKTFIQSLASENGLLPQLAIADDRRRGRRRTERAG